MCTCALTAQYQTATLETMYQKLAENKKNIYFCQELVEGKKSERRVNVELTVI